MAISPILNKFKKIKRLNNDIKATQEKYPGLTVIYSDGMPIGMSGDFMICDLGGIVQGEWKIRVEIPSNYPYGFPVLYETSEKIVRSPDTHIGLNGMACVELDILAFARARKGITILTFFEDYVYKFFCWNLLYASGETSDLHSWGHKEEGHKELFYQYLNSRDEVLISKCINLMEENNLPRRNDPCFCGSSLKFKRCHEAGVTELKAFNLNLQVFKKYFEN